MSTHFYQLGGFRPHIQGLSMYDDRDLAATITSNQPSPLQLVLGIKPSGSSHLLLTEEQRCSLSSCRIREIVRYNNPYLLPSDFESLSPIFLNAEELIKKLSMLKPKAVKKNRDGDGPPQDNSQANKIYSDSIPRPERGDFERGRACYHILSKPHRDFRHLNVSDTTWTQNLRVCAFTFNTKGYDTRPWKERIESPAILDFGWAEASLPSFSPKDECVHHIKLSRNRYISIPGKVTEEFYHGQTEFLHDDTIKSRFQELLKGHLSSIANEPMILLVHNESVSRNALKSLGVDLSAWQSGIKDLLNGGRNEQKYWNHSHCSSTSKLSYDDYEARKSRKRSRSRSPNRSTYVSRPLPSPSRRERFPPGYIIDIEAMYKVLMQEPGPNLRGIATFLRLGDPLDQDARELWCAGNEAVAAIDIWRSMISGPAIDEQRDWRKAVSRNSSAFVVKQPEAGAGLFEHTNTGEDDDDPNDFNGPTVTLQTKAPFDPDSESDYGSD